MKTVKRSRKPAASDPTRDKLLDVAGRIFADRGYRAATIREICIAAGANVAAVNYHFGDKLGLYTEVVRQSMRMAELEAMQNALDQIAAPEVILRSVILVPAARHLQARPAGLVLPHPGPRDGAAYACAAPTHQQSWPPALRAHAGTHRRNDRLTLQR